MYKLNYNYFTVFVIFWLLDRILFDSIRVVNQVLAAYNLLTRAWQIAHYVNQALAGHTLLSRPWEATHFAN